MKQLFVIETKTEVAINETNVESAITNYFEDRLGITLHSVTTHEIKDVEDGRRKNL